VLWMVVRSGVVIASMYWVDGWSTEWKGCVLEPLSAL